MKKRIVLSQFNWCYDKDVYIPLSAGILAAVVRADEELNTAYEVDDWLRFERGNPEQIAEGMGDVDVAGFSISVWNTEISLAVARALEKRLPNCLIVFGGPSVPDNAESFLRSNPSVAIAVRGEGERAFAEVLRGGVDDWARTPGVRMLTRWNEAFTECFHPERYVEVPMQRSKDLSRLPSPFLTGVFNTILKTPYHFNGIWECARGCPYSCTFCDWGSATNAKIAQFPEDRLLAELAWFADHKIDFIYCADANWGILPRDFALTEKIAAQRRERGYPRSFFVNYPKNSTRKIFDLAKMLHDEGLCKGATLSMQSNDPQTLANIKRSNIKLDTYRELQKLYNDAGVPTYTELIVGLPGETLDTFCAGIDAAIDAGASDGVFIYPCRVLPGTEMADPLYRQAHGLVTRMTPILANHADIGAANVGPTEYEETVIGTSTMPTLNWVTAMEVSWFIQSFFCLGLARYPLLWLKEKHGVTVTKFARWFLAQMEADMDQRNWWTNGSRLWQERRRVGFYVNDLWLNVTPEYLHDLEEFPKIRWPIEEASLLALLAHRDAAFVEIGQIFATFCTAHNVDATGTLRAVDENKKRLAHWTTDREFKTPMEFARHRIWFGRRGGSLLR